MIGERAEAYPELVDAVIQGGHSIGVHNYSHPTRTFWAFGRRKVADELDRSLEALMRGECRPQLFRSPVGIKNVFLRRALSARRLHCVAWSIRSGDALSRSVASVVARVEQELRPGAIILLHEGPPMDSSVRIEAIRAVVAMIQTKGFRCVLPERERWVR